MRTHHKFRKTRSFFYKKVLMSASETLSPLSAYSPHWTNPSFPTPDFECLLWTAPCENVFLLNILHLLENTFDRKRIYANPSYNPKAQ